MAGCFRTFRKKGAAAIAITQSLDDFLETHFGRIILQTTYHKFIFHQPLGLHTGFDEFDRERIRNIRTKKGSYSEFYYKSSKHRKTLRYYPTPLEYELFTSDKLENERMLPFLEEHLKYFCFQEAMDKWVRAKYE